MKAIDLLVLAIADAITGSAIFVHFGQWERLHLSSTDFSAVDIADMWLVRKIDYLILSEERMREAAFRLHEVFVPRIRPSHRVHLALPFRRCLCFVRLSFASAWRCSILVAGWKH